MLKSCLNQNTMKRLFFLIVVMFLFSCTEKKVVINKIDFTEHQVPKRIIEYQDAWEAMQNLCFDHISKNRFSNAQIRFSEGLRFLQSNRLDESMEAFKSLYENSTEQVAVDNSLNMLKNGLFAESRWDELIKLYRQNDSIDSDSNKKLVKAFSGIPRERFIYPDHQEVISLQLNRGNAPIVEVRVNGKKQRFLLDTGAGLSVISSRIAEKCGVKPISEDSGVAKAATGKRIDVMPAYIDDLSIGKISIKNHPVIVIDKKDLQIKLLGLFTLLRIDGIIGWNALKKMDVEIDYVNRMLKIQEPVKKDDKGHNLFCLNKPIVRLIGSEGIPLLFSLDTGANTTSVFEGFFNKLTSVASHGANDESGSNHEISSSKTRTWSAGGFQVLESKHINNYKLFLNKYSIEFEQLSSLDNQSDNFITIDGVFGNDLFLQGSIKIDCLNGIFEFIKK